jgi:hypothetical protein
MGGYYKKPGRGGSLLTAHDYDRSRNLPLMRDISTAEQLWSRYERFRKAVAPATERARVRLGTIAAANLPRHGADSRFCRRSAPNLRHCPQPRERHHFHATGYPRLLHPDHVPEYPGDPGQHAGWGYAVGQIKAMMRQL